ncbi:translation initiation factor IF-3, mitochondrial-like [Argopecten irradians]|uniref:translation initiation factor IF-3, mitochondrial-like n=1 Tax=Argopecten irradians TaxID=31199 RepID=UPI003721F134
MIASPCICRLQTLCATVHSLIPRKIHLLNRLDLHQISTSQCMPKWTQFESRVCFDSYRQLKGSQSFRDIRFLSTDAESKMVLVIDDKTRQKLTLKKAKILAHKEGKKLFHIPDEEAGDMDEYKLLSADDFHKEILKYKVEKMKEFNLGVNIQEHDLSTKLQTILRHVQKGLAVRVILSSQGYGAKKGRTPLEGKPKEDAEKIMALCVEALKDITLVTRVVKGKWNYVIEFQNQEKNKPK